jgi:predicted O-linked N-acetylglucosamine transferase (SPINDLY family)
MRLLCTLPGRNAKAANAVKNLPTLPRIVPWRRKVAINLTILSGLATKFLEKVLPSIDVRKHERCPQKCLHPLADLLTLFGVWLTSSRSFPQRMTRESVEPWVQVAASLLGQLGGQHVVEVLGSLGGPQIAAGGQASASVFGRFGFQVHVVSASDQKPVLAWNISHGTHRQCGRFESPIDFINRLSERIDLLYLDAWPVGEAGYKERHRDLYLAARDKLHERSILLINDTDVDFCGKAEFVVHAAEEDGFHIVHWGRQSLLMREPAIRDCEPLPLVGQTPPGSATFEDALRLHQAGYQWQAARIYERILRDDPKHACALHLLGLAAHQRGRHEDGLELIGRAIVLQPLTAVFFSNYGAILQTLGRLPEAIACFSHAVSLQRNCPDALSNLANAYTLLGKPNRAEKLFREVLEYDPNHLSTLHRLGNLLVKLGKRTDAIAMLERAIELAPQDARLHADLGTALVLDNRLSDAVRLYRRSLALKGRDSVTMFNLGSALAHQDLLEEAEECFSAAWQIDSRPTLGKLHSLLRSPSVFRSCDEIDAYRAQLEARLDEVLANPPSVEPSDLYQIGFCPPFQLAYQGRCNRRIKEKFATLAEKCLQPVNLTPRAGKPRIGFVVTRGHEGVFLRCMTQILRGLNKREFEVYVFAPLSISRKMREVIKDGTIKFQDFREDLGHAKSVIADASCDVLYHWEVGSDALNYLLPAFRLAPVQCTSWGTHVTSGHHRIDYYLSSELIETANADRYCTEKLWKFRTLPTSQQRLPRPADAHKSHFGLPDGNVYLCFQTVLKLHPDQDVLFGEVLRRDPKGTLAIKLGPHDRPNEVLKQRLSKTLADVFDRILFVPYQSREDFHRLVAVADVLLDTHHFSAGTTCYDGFSFGQAFVTLPTDYNIGRYTLACYRKMGFEPLIASSPAHYGELAARLANDPGFRKTALESIQERSNVLFDDQSAIREHEDFFRLALEESKKIG